MHFLSLIFASFTIPVIESVSGSDWVLPSGVSDPIRAGVSAGATAMPESPELRLSTESNGSVWSLIPGGQFVMGDQTIPPEGDLDELPVHSVDVGPFYMSKFEITNAEYAAALNWALAQGGLIEITGGIVHKWQSIGVKYCQTNPTESTNRIIWNGTAFSVVAGKENHPMLRVSWYGAAAFANWRSMMDGLEPAYDTTSWACDFNASGYRLPTEAEWEKACRGGLTEKRFPWGDILTGNDANYLGSGDAFEGIFPSTTPVGDYPPNGYGLHDMAGNLWEWVNDWYDPMYYALSPFSNPQGPTDGVPCGDFPMNDCRVARGGCWANDVSNPIRLRCSERGGGEANELDWIFGFRLARSAQDSVPAVSQWGLVVLVLLTMTAGTMTIRMRSV